MSSSASAGGASEAGVGLLVFAAPGLERNPKLSPALRRSRPTVAQAYARLSRDS